MFGLLGPTPGLFARFVVFGFMVGVFFGVLRDGRIVPRDPALLILGYPAPVATWEFDDVRVQDRRDCDAEHHDTGQVDYRLGALMFVGIALGIEGGSRLVFGLEALGIAEAVVGIAYIFVLAAIGSSSRGALNGDDEGRRRSRRRRRKR